MPTFEISGSAKSDLREIAMYTRKTWGSGQARKYIELLRDRFRQLAANRKLGRPCDSLLPGLRRLEVEKHVVFYLEGQHGVLIVRILHSGMLPLPRYFD